MFRISKLTDYATVILADMAGSPERIHSASELAERARLELPTVSKVMKLLAQAGLVESFRGAAGGYRLAHPVEQISVADILSAIEGPIGMTECSLHAGMCGHESHCGVSAPWQRVSQAVEATLRGIALSEMRASIRQSRPAIPHTLTAG